MDPMLVVKTQKEISNLRNIEKKDMIKDDKKKKNR
jgi:hypothetical protein